MWVGIAVASHWVLDCITHRPDLPLYPGGEERLGLGCGIAARDFRVEGSMFAAGIALYLQCTKAKDRSGTVAWWAYIALLLILYISGTLVSAAAERKTRSRSWNHRAGDPGPWAYWIDRHRLSAS